MNNKKYLIAVFIIGIVLRFYPTITQPLWLDEVYSLYFASNFSFIQILFHLPDCHPGFFYLILKTLLFFSTSSIFLRTILGIIPQIIGCYIIQRQFKKPILTTIFLLNPFFIYYAWQIRMYGLVFLITILVISLLSQPKYSAKKLIFLIFIANLTSYSFIIPSICLLLYLSYKKNITWLYVIPLVVLQFFVFKGPQYKTFTESASWISAPSFNNIPNILLTSLGLASDLNSQSQSSILFSIIFYLIFGYVIYKISKNNLSFLFNFILSFLITILISITFPILSQRYFFYLFIPKISLFLPRFLLPLSIIFYFFVFNSSRRFPKIIIFILLIVWIKTYLTINPIKLDKPTTPSKNTNSKILYLPPWENLYLPSSYSLIDIKNISQDYDTALIIEKQLLQTPPDCTKYYQYSKIIYRHQSINSLSLYQNQIIKAISYCLSPSI